MDLVILIVGCSMLGIEYGAWTAVAIGLIAWAISPSEYNK